MVSHSTTGSPPTSLKGAEAATTLHSSEKVKDEGETHMKKPPPFKHSWSVSCKFFVLCLLSFLTALDGTIITTSIPTITAQSEAATNSSTPFLAAIALFALGSGIAGGAHSPVMLITGRAVQGLGAAGLYVLSDILICDLVPPRHREPYLSAMLSTAGIGSTIGPSTTTAGRAGVTLSRAPTTSAPSSSSHPCFPLFYALITGGIQNPWSSWRVLLPLVLGICGWLPFHVHQATPSFCSPAEHPTTSTHQSSSPPLSGVYYLPFALAIMPFAGISGWALSRWGNLFSTLDGTSSRAAWVGFHIIPSAGIALVYTAALPSTLAPLEEEDVAVATAAYSFIRSFGFVWGLTLAGIVFNGQVDACLGFVGDEGAEGGAEGESEGWGGSLRQAIEVYVRALRVAWLVAMAVALLGFVCVPLERWLELKKDHTTKYGLKEKGREKSEGRRKDRTKKRRNSTAVFRT
ncbi:MFS general substrate transporter [Zopfia rhizophila CBS 207.26]|uniref:MFS general substrate transporter n=1 Tax=Zopfia rhizophila CBS 207.26 TaxID=1314779 RepID=A0A6A6DY26_9PEZI|nr:MFS general substrate transporter [Zopfia rhizophila CBS 207.26]